MSDLGLNNIISYSLDMSDNGLPDIEEEVKDSKEETLEDVDSSADTQNEEELEVETDESNTSLDEDNSEDEELDKEDVEKEDVSFNTSPEKRSDKGKFYSSIAKMLQEDGILPDVTDEEIDQVLDPESMSAAIKKQLNTQLSLQTRRVTEALNYDADIDQVREYETTLQVLDGIDVNALSNTDDETVKLRNDLIYQDYINRGFSEQKAVKELKKSIQAGTVIEDAQEALESNKTFYKNAYAKLLADAKKESEAKIAQKEKMIEELREDIISDQGFFKALNVDDNTRKKIAKVITAPTFRNKNGTVETELQHYYAENSKDWAKYMGLFYVMTDGFKNIDKLIGKRVKAEQKKGLQRLDDLLNSTSRHADGSLNLVSGVGDAEAYFGKKWKLDV